MTNKKSLQFDPSKNIFYREESDRLSRELLPIHERLDAVWQSSPLYSDFKRISNLYSPFIAADYLINENKDVRDIHLRHWDISTSVLHYKHRFELASKELLTDPPLLSFVDIAFEIKTKPFLEFYFRNCTLKEGNAMSLGYAIAWVRTYKNFAQHLSSYAEQETKPSCIYFISNSCKTMIKIGYTTDIVQRFNALQSMSPSGLILLGTIDGGTKEEQILHQKYSILRAHGEWFHVTPDFLKDIRGMLKNKTIN